MAKQVAREARAARRRLAGSPRVLVRVRRMGPRRGLQPSLRPAASAKAPLAVPQRRSPERLDLTLVSYITGIGRSCKRGH